MTKEILEQKIFWISEIQNEIESGTYQDFLSQFIEETTTPKGIGAKIFTEFIDSSIILQYYTSSEREDFSEFCWDTANTLTASEIEELGGLWTISSWGAGGNNYKKGTRYFETEEGVNNEYFDYVETQYQQHYCNTYFTTKEEAEKELIRINAEEMGVDIDVYLSIEHHQNCADEIKGKRYIKQQTLKKELSLIYSKLIDKIEGETYSSTVKRLSNAIGEKINGSVFHAAVKLIRSK